MSALPVAEMMTLEGSSVCRSSRRTTSVTAAGLPFVAMTMAIRGAAPPGSEFCATIAVDYGRNLRGHQMGRRGRAGNHRPGDQIIVLALVLRVPLLDRGHRVLDMLVGIQCRVLINNLAVGRDDEGRAIRVLRLLGQDHVVFLGDLLIPIARNCNLLAALT